jgi:hypothetical protein
MEQHTHTLNYVVGLERAIGLRKGLGLNETIESLAMNYLRQRMASNGGNMSIIDVLESLQKVFETIKNLDSDLREGRLPFRTLNLLIDPEINAYHKSLTSHYRVNYLVERLRLGDGWHKISDEEFVF